MILGYLRKALGLWIVLLFISLMLAATTKWDPTTVGLTVGIVAGFLPSLVLAVLTNIRDWNLENIEKIYAPLMSEIQGLLVYFSGSKEFNVNTFFDYAEMGDSKLDMSTWDQLHKDNLMYRLRFDDKALYDKLSHFYLILSSYMKNRMDFLHSTFYPAFCRVCNLREPEIDVDIVLPKIRIAVRNFVLDELEPGGREIKLGFYAGHTSLYSDYEQARSRANIPEATFEAFLLRIKREIDGDNYSLLVGQRANLFRDVSAIQSKIDKKLKQALPT